MRCYVYLAQNGYYYRHCDPDPHKYIIILIIAVLVIALMAVLTAIFRIHSNVSPMQNQADWLVIEARRRWLAAKNEYEDMAAELEDTIQQVERQWLKKR